MSPLSAPPTTTPSSAPSRATKPRTSPSTANPRPLLPPNMRHTPPPCRQRRNPEQLYCGGGHFRPRSCSPRALCACLLVALCYTYSRRYLRSPQLEQFQYPHSLRERISDPTLFF